MATNIWGTDPDLINDRGLTMAVTVAVTSASKGAVMSTGKDRVRARAMMEHTYGRKSFGVAGYTYQAEILCPSCVRRIAAVPGVDDPPSLEEVLGVREGTGRFTPREMQRLGMLQDALDCVHALQAGLERYVR